MTVDRESPRYAQLYWHYHAHYAQAVAAQGGAADPAEQDRYAREHAEAVWAAEAAAAPAAEQAAPPLPAAPAFPASVAPTVPAGHALGQAPVPGAPAVATLAAPAAVTLASPAAPRRRRTGLLVGALVAGVVVIALVVAGILVVPSLLSSPSASTRLPDYTAKPQPAWSTTVEHGDYVGLSVEALGADRLLAVEDVDGWSWKDRRGSAAPYADPSRLTALSSSDGSVLWSVAASDVLPAEREGEQYLSVRRSTDGAHVVVATGGAASARSSASLAVLRGADGSVLSSTVLDGILDSMVIAGDRLILSVVTPAGAEVRAVSLADTGTALWRHAVDASALPQFVDMSDQQAIGLWRDGRATYLDVETGRETVWSDGRIFRTLGGALIAFGEWKDDGLVLARIEKDGTQRWEVRVDAYQVVDGELFVFTGGRSDAGYRDLGRLDLGTGRSAWPAPAGDYQPMMVSGGRVLVAEVDGDGWGSTHWLDLGNGRVTGAPAPAPAEQWWGDVDRAFGPSTMYILDSDIQAYALNGSGRLWTYGLEEDEWARVLHSRLYVWNGETATLTALR